MKNITITDKDELVEIIKSIDVCSVGMVDGDKPYVLPFNFAYRDNCIYLHSGKGGRKLDVLNKNDNVSIAFEKDSVLNIRHENVACSYSMKFKSVILSGKALFVDDFDEKVDAMNFIMEHYTGKSFTYNKPAIDNIVIIKVEIEEISGRKRGYE